MSLFKKHLLTKNVSKWDPSVQVCYIAELEFVIKETCPFSQIEM